MKVKEILVRSPVTVAPETTVTAAAELMAAEGVGSLIVSDHDRLVGIVTDRDLVVRVLARGYPPDARVDSVMSMNVVAIDADADVREAMAAFGHHAVRRLPVVHGAEIMGLLSLDELVAVMVGQLGDVTHGLRAQLMFPHRAPAAPPATR